MDDYQIAREALSYIDPNLERLEWLKVGTALKNRFGEDAKEMFQGFSQQAEGFKQRDFEHTWKSLNPNRASFGTLLHIAKQYGYQPQRQGRQPFAAPQNQAERDKREAERQRQEQERAAKRAEDVQNAQKYIRLSPPADFSHPYLQKKGIDTPEGIAGLKHYRMNNGTHILYIPIQDADGNIQGVERIWPDGNKGILGNMKGGYFVMGDLAQAKDKGVIFAEGFATAYAVHKHSDHTPVVITFNADNMLEVAKAIKDRLPPDTALIVAADNDHHLAANGRINKGLEGAQKVVDFYGSRATMIYPEFPSEVLAKGSKISDYDDYLRHVGSDGIRQAVTSAKEKLGILPEKKTEQTKDSIMATVENPNTQAAKTENLPDYVLAELEMQQERAARRQAGEAAVLEQTVVATPAEPTEKKGKAAATAAATAADAGDGKAAAGKDKAGKPKETAKDKQAAEPKPWEQEGISRTTWYKNKAVAEAVAAAKAEAAAEAAAATSPVQNHPNTSAQVEIGADNRAKNFYESDFKRYEFFDAGIDAMYGGITPEEIQQRLANNHFAKGYYGVTHNDGTVFFEKNEHGWTAPQKGQRPEVISLAEAQEGLRRARLAEQLQQAAENQHTGGGNATPFNSIEYDGRERAGYAPADLQNGQPTDTPPSFSVSDSALPHYDPRVVGEVIVEYGYAPYQHNPENSENFYLTLADGEGKQRTMWGIGLPEALEKAQAQVGDQVLVENLGRKPVTVEEAVKDADGNVVGNRTIETHRNEFSIDVTADKAQIDQYRREAIEQAIRDSDIREQIRDGETPDSMSEQADKAFILATDPELKRDQSSYEQAMLPPSDKFVIPDFVSQQYIPLKEGRYLVDRHTEKLAIDARSDTILKTQNNDHKTIENMLAIAERNGWESVKVKGTEEFRREMWLQASLKGMTVKGYKPTELDRKKLELRRNGRDKADNSISRGETPVKQASGTLVGYGTAKHPDHGGKTYYVDLRGADGQQQRQYGLGLRDAIIQSSANKGDHVTLNRTGYNGRNHTWTADVSRQKTAAQQLLDNARASGSKATLSAAQQLIAKEHLSRRAEQVIEADRRAHPARQKTKGEVERTR